MPLAVVGSRKITDRELVWKHINEFMGACHSMTWFRIVSGGAQGVDTHARAFAKAYDLSLTEYLPDYINCKPKVAPLIRNTKIVADADHVLAIVCKCSRGTWDTIRKARRCATPVSIITEHCESCRSLLDKTK